MDIEAAKQAYLRAVADRAYDFSLDQLITLRDALNSEISLRAIKGEADPKP